MKNSMKLFTQYAMLTSPHVASYSNSAPTEKPCKGCGVKTGYTIKRSEFSRTYMCKQCQENEESK